MASHFFKKATSLSRQLPLSLAVILLAITILRIPTFFEPYWYGDEGIYLVIGTALNRGARLYAEIVDHKTPLIYYFAQVQSQLSFRFLLYIWMIISTTAFFYISTHFTNSLKTVILASSIFAIFTTLPWFEGNIANGELFVMGFVLVAIWIFTRTQYFQIFKNATTLRRYSLNKKESLLLFATGVELGLGILTKVPALFDAVAVLGVAYFIMLRYLNKHFLQALRTVIQPTAVLLVGVLTPLMLSILYYYLIGSGTDYLEFGLLYNFKYAGTWLLDFSNPLLRFLFTLPGKVTFLVVATVLISLGTKLLKPTHQFALFWFSLALVASLLSNRPYPHYFLQVIPPLALVLALGAAQAWNALKHKNTRVAAVVTAATAFLCLVMFVGTLKILHVGLYPTVSYYQKFISYSTGSLSQEEYYQSFNYLMKENYQVSQLLRSEAPDKIFIWGTNPMLYALSGTRPVGKFTVAFHIEDLDVYQETMAALLEEKPLYIIVMKNQQTPLPGLNSLLNNSYIPVKSTDHMIIWRKLNHKQV